MSQIVFLSDFHLGVPDYIRSRDREIKICQFLDSIKDKTSEIFFVGDLFDFWFEYDTSAPKGYYRLFGKLAELADKGIKIHIFKGNHDMWMKDLFVREFNANIIDQPIEIERFGKKIFVGHGDGLGPGDLKYKFLKLFFASSFCQFLFKWIHPDIGMRMANFFSYRSRFGQPETIEKYLGNAREWLYIFCQNKLKTSAIDYFIFGHRHLPIYTNIDDTNVIYINLGDWLHYDTYSILDENGIYLKQFGSDQSNNDFNPNISLSTFR